MYLRLLGRREEKQFQDRDKGMGKLKQENTVD